MAEIIWRPPAGLVSSANVSGFMREHGIADVDALLKRSIDEQDWFWDAAARHLRIEFAHPYHTVRDSSRGIPWTDWYVGGKLNIFANCLDRHLAGPQRKQVCLIAEREDGQVTRLTFAQLAAAVDRCAAGLAAAGVGAGDRVGAFMPMTAEVVVQLLATLKLGAIFIPIFSGYAAPAVAERLRDAGAKLLFTADLTRRRGGPVYIKKSADAAAADAPSVTTVVVVRYSNETIPWDATRDVSWQDFLARGTSPPTQMVDSMDPALILYTSGTTGRPKGTVHSHAGALVQIAKEVGYAFDVKPGDRFFWLTDIG
ncbi:MAG TPA: AMP-binding protein, partial [Gemmatimonadota bacterium]|nr:AMP-binding protein [Gemmatimonadota bacterium]